MELGRNFSPSSPRAAPPYRQRPPGASPLSRCAPAVAPGAAARRCRGRPTGPRPPPPLHPPGTPRCPPVPTCRPRLREPRAESATRTAPRPQLRSARRHRARQGRGRAGGARGWGGGGGAREGVGERGCREGGECVCKEVLVCVGVHGLAELCVCLWGVHGCVESC